MDDADLEAILAGRSSGPFPMDDAMLGTASAGAGSGGRSVREREPRDFLRPETANAVLVGAPEPQLNIHEHDTSCDESEDDYPEDDQGDDDDVDALFGEPSRAPPRRPRGPKTRLECFGCTISMQGGAGGSDNNIEASKMRDLIQMYVDLSPTLEPWTVASMCHQFYKTAIYDEKKRQGITVPMWHTKEIYEHFYHHGLDPTTFLMQQIREWREISTMLYRSSASRVLGGSGAVPEKENIALKLRVDAHLRNLWRHNIAESNFHNTGAAPDPQEIGKHVPAHRNFRNA